MHILIVGGRRAERIGMARLHERGPVRTLDAAQLPFTRLDRSAFGSEPPDTVRIDDCELAFPNQQTGGTRLILTQSTYLIQKVVDALPRGARIVATAAAASLSANAAESLEQRGVWRLFTIERLPDDASDVETLPDTPLVRAFHSHSAAERLALCREASRLTADSAVAALALASASLEGQQIAEARAALDRSLQLAPDWEAAHYEDGKFWLAHEDLERARAAFERACRLMPTFSAAFINLGSTLGELDLPEAALDAFREALASDPESFTILNNIGVVSRELGRLDDSEQALRRVIQLAPGFVFGHYNLGHTLFFQGRYPEALAAYEEGQRRDPQQNRRQGCRLAMMRFANGDVKGAARDLWRFTDAAPPDERTDLLEEAYEIALALLAAHPELKRFEAFADRIRHRAEQV